MITCRCPTWGSPNTADNSSSGFRSRPRPIICLLTSSLSTLLLRQGMSTAQILRLSGSASSATRSSFLFFFIINSLRSEMVMDEEGSMENGFSGSESRTQQLSMTMGRDRNSNPAGALRTSQPQASPPPLALLYSAELISRRWRLDHSTTMKFSTR